MPVEQIRRSRRHERILEAALQVFSRKGYHDTAVDDIALQSGTSKGGVYFHFPTKQALFLALLDRMAALLRSRVEAAIAAEPDPIARADIALQVVLQTFASHRTLSRLFFVEAFGAGREFDERMAAIRASFADLIRQHLDDAVRQGSIPPLATAVAGRVWFGALNEVVTHWVLAEPPARLDDAYPTLRSLLLRGIGAQVPTPVRAAGAAPGTPPTPHPARRDPPGMDGEGDGGTGRVGDGESGGRDSPRPPVPASPRLDQNRLRSLLQEGLRQARRQTRPVVASAVLPAPPCDPVTFFARGARVDGDRLLWTRPRAGYAMAGVGAARTLSLEGADRFAAAAAAWRELTTSIIVDAPGDTIGVGPVLMGGFAFDPLRPPALLWEGFPAGLLLLPRYLLTAVDGAAWLTVNTVVWPDSDPSAELECATRACATLVAAQSEEAGGSPPPRVPHLPVQDVMPAAEWKAIVHSLTREVRRGAVEKVVLARECRVRAPSPCLPVPPSPRRPLPHSPTLPLPGSPSFDVPLALQRLRADYPSCFLFAVARGDRCFLGASPERLVRLRDGIASTMCLAGSIARGATEEEDRRLGAALLASEKDRAEHAVVVRALREALAEVCDEVAPISTPVVLKVRNIQHLLTTLVGRVADGRTVLELVERLHPTPAVGGYPRDTALRLIREREQFDRGWYAGPIGWLDTRGEGEFAVAIRSALVHGPEASLFAGCGLVADSAPEDEYEESRLKLRPMLSALGGETS